MARKKDSYKTTKAHFELFKKECWKWIEKFGLYDWQYYFFHEDWEDGNRATIKYNVKSRAASINLSPIWNTPITNLEVRRSAFHEVMEAMLGDLYLMGESREFDEALFVGESHKIIRRLENVVFDKMGG